MTNKVVNNKQCKLIGHVNDLQISHSGAAVVENEIRAFQLIYGPLLVVRGDIRPIWGLIKTTLFQRKLGWP